ncbi:hypothetical protein RHIZ404_200489 [Rhizobium sp. EC-SD404]|nr:hypothetical protein RHIZ404_200489 [Rhizobium sp. EC-SD404]
MTGLQRLERILDLHLTLSAKGPLDCLRQDRALHNQNAPNEARRKRWAGCISSPGTCQPMAGT